MGTRCHKDYKNLEESLAKIWADANGYTSSQNGWIFHAPLNTRPVCRGWHDFYCKYRREILNDLCTRYTAFADFEALINAPGGYRPTMMVDHNWKLIVLAKEYDQAQARRNDPRRAYIPDWPADCPQWVKDAYTVKEPPCCSPS